ncbi:MAG: hypothetical protein HYU51_01245 [Candidatus Rokubacteria bacterium]|nr:hypothetical protein [Candidatus Rokubacteria bacterium]
MGQRLADLIRRARKLASDRDRLVESLAEDWVRALRDHGLSRRDLEELWAALTEEALRRAGSSLDEKWTSPVVRQETEEVIARLRARVEAALGDDAAAR